MPGVDHIGAGSVNQPAARRPTAFIPFHAITESLECLRVESGIAVHQQNKLTVSSPDTLIASRAKSEVCRVLNQADASISLADRFDATVRRCVVDDHQF